MYPWKHKTTGVKGKKALGHWPREGQEKKVSSQAAMWLTALGTAILLIPVPVFATSEITSMFDNFYSLLSTIITSIGAAILLWNAFEFGQSMNSRESTMITGALRGLGGGMVMLLAPSIVSAIRGS